MQTGNILEKFMNQNVSIWYYQDVYQMYDATSGESGRRLLKQRVNVWNLRNEEGGGRKHRDAGLRSFETRTGKC